MKVTVDRDPLQAALAKALGTVVRTTTLPILQHLLLRAEGDVLTVIAAEPDMQVQVRLAASVETAGAATVPASRLHDIVRNLAAGADIGLSLEGGRVVLKSCRSRFQLPSFPAADFPVFETAAPSGEARIPAADLRRLIDRTAFAVSQEQTRYYITGLRFGPVMVDGQPRLRAVATDGARLALAEAACPKAWAEMAPVTAPLKAVNEIRRLLEGVSGEVSIGTNGRLFAVVLDEASLCAKLIEANYPDYTRVIPRDNRNTAHARVAPLAAALKRCALMAADKARTVTLDIEAGQLTLRARDGEGGEAEEVVEAEVGAGSGEFRFNSKYLAELLAQIGGETVRIEFGSPNDAWRVVDPADASAEFVIMPWR